VLGISKDTVVNELKKQTEIEPIHRPFLDRLADPARPIILAQETEAEEILWAGRPRHAGCGKPRTIEPGLSSPRAAVQSKSSIIEAASDQGEGNYDRSAHYDQ
jgi:hypothetical protein